MLGGVLSGDLSHIGLSSGCRQVQKIHQNAKCFPMEIETAHADLDPEELYRRFLWDASSSNCICACVFSMYLRFNV